MSASIGQGPQIAMTLPVKTDNKIDLQASIADLSGIAKLELWDGVPGSGTLVAEVYRAENDLQSVAFSHRYDLAGKSGTHVLYVKAYDGAGNSSVNSVTLSALSAPKISAIVPTESSVNVALKPTIVITFDREMDLSALNSTSVKLFKYDGGALIAGLLSYQSDSGLKTWTFTPNTQLDPNTKYKLVVYDSVKDVAGYSIDGDNDGNAGGNFYSSFSTGSSVLFRILQLSSYLWNAISSGAMSAHSVKAMGVTAQAAGDNIIDPGETIELTLTLTNSGSQPATGVSGTISTASGVNITSANQSYGDIPAGTAKANANKFVFNVPSSFTGSEIQLNLAVSGQVAGDSYSDNLNVILPVGTSLLAPPGAGINERPLDFGFYNFPGSATLYYLIDDNTDLNSVGNGNGIFDEGDGIVNIKFFAGNASEATLNADFQLTSDPGFATINDQPIKSNIVIQPKSYIEIPFSLTKAGYVSDSTTIPLVIKMTAAGEERVRALSLPYTKAPSLNQNILLTSIDPVDVFSPNEDGKKDQLTMRYVLSEDCDIVFLEARKRLLNGSWENNWTICNAFNLQGSQAEIGGNRRVLNEDAWEFTYKKNNDYSIIWSNGNGYESGCYQLRIKAFKSEKDYFGKVYWDGPFSSNVQTIYLHKTSPKADNLSVTPKFSPFNPGLPGTANIAFDLTDAADMLIKVRNKNGLEIRTLADVQLSPKGHKEFVFESYDLTNNILLDGQYTVNLRLDDRANSTAFVTREVTIDHAPQDFYLIMATNEVLTSAATYELAWTPATPFGPEWNHLKEYQIMGYKVGGGASDYGVLVKNIAPTATSGNFHFQVDGVWKIKIRAIDDEGNWQDSDGTNSAGFAGNPNRILTVCHDSSPPGPMALLSPYDGQYFAEGKLLIIWKPVKDVNLDHYELCIGTDQNNIHGSSVIYRDLTKDSTSFEAELPGGIYYIYLAAYDKADHYRVVDGTTDIAKFNQSPGTVFAGKWPSFEIDHLPPVITFNPDAYPPVSNRYFSPNGDGKKETTKISYSVTDESYWRVNHLRQNEISLEVMGEIIKDGDTVIGWTNKSPPGWQRVCWNGNDENGKKVEDGLYTIKITATDKALNSAVNDSQWTVVDTTSPEIRNIAGLSMFSPNNDGEFDEGKISFEVTDNLSPRISVTIEVVDNENKIIIGPMEPRRLAVGFFFAWDGKTLNGGLVPDGKYKYKITAEDLAGNLIVNDSTSIVIDTKPPEIINLTDTISRLQFKENSGSLDIKFKLLEASGYANVFASVLDSKGAMIRNCLITAEAGKQYQVSWNGKDSFGFFIPNNSYVYYRLYAIDCVGNKKYLDSDQLIRVETPYTGMSGNILYSPDGELKIIVPQGALSSEAELSIGMNDAPKSYQINGNDTLTLTYQLLPEGVKLNKPCQILFHYDPSKLNSADQSVLPFEYTDSKGWEQLSGNFKNDVFSGFIDKSGSFVIGTDLTPPEPPTVNQPKTPTASSLINVSGTAEHNSTVALNMNGNIYHKTVNSPDWSVSNIGISEGENIIFATAKDTAGNISKSSNKITVIKDTTPPILIVSNADNLYLPSKNTVNLSASASDGGSPTCEVRLSIKDPEGKGIFLENYNNNFSLGWGNPSLSEGTYPYVIRAIDQLNNYSEKSGSVIVDKTAPYVLLDLQPINYYLSGNLELWGVLDDANISSWVLDYGEGANPISFTEIARGFSVRPYEPISNFDTHFLSTGLYTFRLTAYDKAGNVKVVTKTKNIINSAVYSAIFSPGINENVRGTAVVSGMITLNSLEFSRYSLLYGKGADPSSWAKILISDALPKSDNLGQWNTSGLSDGLYTLRLETVNLGAESFLYDVPVVIDNTSPISRITYPAGTDVLGGIIGIVGTVSDACLSYYKVEYGEGINPLSWNEIKTSNSQVLSERVADWNTGSLNGTYTVRLTAYDKAGNSTLNQTTFTIDNIVDASLNYPTNDMVLADTLHIQGTAADNNFASYCLEYGGGRDPSIFTKIGTDQTNQVTNGELGVWDTKSVSDGIYTIREVVVDKAGNEGVKTVTIIVDNTYPTVSISNPIAGSCLAGTIGVAGTVYDENIQSYKVEYQSNSNPGCWNYIYSTSEAANIQNDAVFNWAANALNGAYTIKVSATDKTGKTSSNEVAVILDNTSPIITITSPSRESVNTGDLDIIGEIADVNFKNYLIKYGYGIEPTQFWQLTSGASAQNGALYSWQTSRVKDGYYTLRVETEDKAGNRSSRDFPIIIDNAPAIAEIQAPVESQVVSGEVNIQGIVCDADFTTYNFKRYEISVGIGEVPVQWVTIESLATPKINEVLKSWNTIGVTDGTYTIKLRSRDISGVTEKTRSIIIDNTKPVLSITSPNDGATISGDVQIMGAVSDTNPAEYKIYYKNDSSSDWTEISGGAWNTALVGDGSYSIKLWAKDKAGNESEIFRNYIVNNALDVNSVSLSAAAFSPNGDGIDDKIKLKYNLTANSNVTVKIYKKPSSYSYNWLAFGSGTRYPAQSFSYTLSASGKDYPAQVFGWKVDASGTETYEFPLSRDGISGLVSPASGVYFLQCKIGCFGGSNFGDNIYIDHPQTVNVSWNGVAIYSRSDATASSPSSFIGNTPLQVAPGWYAFVKNVDLPAPNPSYFTIYYTTQNFNHSSDVDSGLATKYYDGMIGGNSYSVILSPQNGGAINGHAISYSQTSNTSGVSSSRDSSSWSGNICSGVINATYNYSGDGWSDSTSLSTSVNAQQGEKIVSGAVASIFGAVGGEPYRTYSSISASAPSGSGGPNVNLRFKNSGTTTTSDTNDYLIASTNYSEPWNTSMDPSVGNGGWLKKGLYSLPFSYNEAPDLRNIYSYYSLPSSDIAVSGWNVTSDNSFAKIYGVNSSGNFNISLADNILVKTLQYDISTTAGEHFIEWDGTDNNGNTVSDNDYIFVVYAGGNTLRKGINGEYPVKVEQAAEISALAVSETVISPNGDGVQDSTDINYTLSRNANSLSAVIKDQGGTAVRTISGPSTSGLQSIAWNGKNDSNSIVPDGKYSAVVTAVNANGATRVKSMSLTVDNNNPSASDEVAKLIVGSSAWEESPAYSPDKTKIAFAKEISGKKQICVLNLANSQLTQVTTQGENKQPNWSPDGSKIAFISDRSGSVDIWKMNLDGSIAKQLTANSAVENNPKWLPDGSKIVYASDRLGELLLAKWNLWEINADGSSPTQVTKDQTTFRDDDPSASPDGKKIVYDSDQTGNFDLWTINPDGSNKAKITASLEAETNPTWSPDGLKIAYQNQKGIGLFDVKNNNSGQLVSQEGATNPSWSKDGTELLYNDNAGNIYSQSTYAGALTGVITYPILNQKLSGLVEIKGTALDTNFEGFKIEYSLNVIPYVWIEIGHSDIPKKDGILAAWNTAPLIDGQYVLRLTARDKAGNSLENSLIVNLNNDNWKLTISSLIQLTSSDAWDFEPSWSPDGSKLAFSSNRSGDYDIWVMNENGTGLANLTSNPAYDGKPSWSPDGAKIAFVSDRSGNKDIWSMNADGTNLKQLTDLTIIDTDPTWSPDGLKIVFASNRSANFDLWVINVDGIGSPTKLTSSEADDREPSWSRFGVAFTSDRSGNKEIWTIDENGTQEAFRLTDNPAGNYEPCWSPFAILLSDGSHRPLITFTSGRQGNPDIYVMDTDGIDQSKSLTDYTNTDCNPAWSPDGSKVAYASFRDGQSDLWVMNFALRTSILSVISLPAVGTMEIISPKGGKKIENLRPTFEWYGVRGYTSYRIVARKDIATWTQPKNITQTEASPESNAKPAITYEIHEFDEGLARGIWNWKVQALDQSNNVLSETTEENFEIDPPLTISGVTNYPNPFNPNREQTKIRYRLSADADEVRIRIYDITGSLVTELDGTTNGEGMSVWQKYNDVSWDGRNGRGDLVVNGIYPFEITARMGDKTVSGRGKIAVLK
ncbi:MAG: FlgD immunoglobulin-like domain containing protein [Candidatus Margulisiibacteriota bacterium]